MTAYLSDGLSGNTFVLVSMQVYLQDEGHNLGDLGTMVLLS